MEELSPYPIPQPQEHPFVPKTPPLGLLPSPALSQEETPSALKIGSYLGLCQ